jgi:transcriptional regulator with XRE-family HTH domain
MKTEQSAFAERLAAALEAAGIEASPSVLEKLVPQYGGKNITPQAVSNWLSGKHLPAQANLRALAHIVGVPPHELRFGPITREGVREANVAWPDHVRGHDRLAIEDFLALPDAQRKLVRELISSLAAKAAKSSA